MWENRVQKALADQKAKDRYRRRVVCQSQGSTSKIMVDDESYFNFSSNDYLGLAHHPEMISAAQKSAAQYGVGSGGSPHVTGFSEPLAALESTLANWLGYDAAIVYPSGFTANQAVIKLLIERGDQMIADRLSHASLLEAAMLSPGRLHRFKHNDIDSLESYLQKYAEISQESLKLVITEGIFSMDGDQAPLQAIARMTKKHRSLLMVDDAHGIGILGHEGRGTCDQLGIQPDILIVTFGKAFGCSGAAVLVSKDLADYFVQFSRPLIYSTAIPPIQASTLLEAIRLIRSEEGDDRRVKLRNNIDYFKAAIARVLEAIDPPMTQEISQISELALPAFTSTHASDQSSDHDQVRIKPYLLDSTSPIQPLVIGRDEDALILSQKLRHAGIWVSAIRPPTVPPQTARLRVTITAEHTYEMIDQFIKSLYQALLEESSNEL